MNKAIDQEADVWFQKTWQHNPIEKQDILKSLKVLNNHYGNSNTVERDKLGQLDKSDDKFTYNQKQFPNLASFAKLCNIVYDESKDDDKINVYSLFQGVLIRYQDHARKVKSLHPFHINTAH